MSLWTVPPTLTPRTNCWEILVSVGHVCRHGPFIQGLDGMSFLLRAIRQDVLVTWKERSVRGIPRATQDVQRAVERLQRRFQDAIERGVEPSSHEGWMLREERERLECALNMLYFMGVSPEALPSIRLVDEMGREHFSVTEPDMEATDLLWSAAVTDPLAWWGACGPATLDDTDVSSSCEHSETPSYS